MVIHIIKKYLIYGLFNEVVSFSDYIVSNDRRLMNSQLEIWKEPVVA
jgi:hypothetical protein